MTERLTFNYGTEQRAVERQKLDFDTAFRPTDQATRTLEDPRRPDWAWRGLLAFTFVLFFRPQDQFPILAPLHLAELTAILALSAVFFQRLRRGQTIVPITPEFLGVAALGALMFLTIPFSVWPGGAYAVFSDVYLKIVAIFLLMVHALQSPKRIERMTWIILLACGYLGFRAISDYARGVNMVEGGRVQGSIGGIFRNPNDLALNLVSYLPIAVFAMIEPGSLWKRSWGAIIAVLMIGAVICTQSRSGAIGLGIILLICAAHVLLRRPALVLAGVLVLAVAVPFVPQSYFQRMASITDESKDPTGSREARKTLMREAVATFVSHPITGVGAGQFKNYNPPDREEMWRETHNAVLQLASELGFLGPLIMFYLVARGFISVRSARAILRRAVDAGTLSASDPAVQWMNAHLSAMSAGIIGWFICAQFASVAYNWTFYYLLALAAAPRHLLIVNGFDVRAARVRSPRHAPAPAQAGMVEA
ncbi:MAG: O-antigen ligase family protein [Acidobacteriota bacterium]